MLNNKEVEKNKREEEFLNNYTENYKKGLGVNIKEFSIEELLECNSLETKKNLTIIEKILKFLCLSK